MNDDDLRAALHAAVPDDPDTSDWAAQAREQSRRRVRRARTMTAGSICVVVLAVLGAVFWPTLVPNSDSLVAEPAHRPAATSASSTPLAGRVGALCRPTDVIGPSRQQPVDLSTVSNGRLCTSSDTKGGIRELVLSADDSRQIAADIQANSGPVQAVPCPSGPRYPMRIMLIDAHGEVLSLSQFCMGYLYGDGKKDLQWTPSPALVDRLDTLAKG